MQPRQMGVSAMERMLRIFLTAAGVSLATVAVPCLYAQRHQVGIDRPGSDYRSFEMPQPDPGACQAICAREGPCRAWTFVRPGVQGPRARCWLKTSIPEPHDDGCCTSGVERAGESYQEGIDRPGMNIDSKALPRPEPALCEAACRKRADCRAWTYVHPGFRGPQSPPECWLKGTVPRSEPNGYCISGVVQRAP